MKQEQCPKCGRPYLRARNGDPPAECRSCKTSLRPQATEPKPLPPHAFPIAPKRPAPPVGPIGPARGRGGLMLAKVTGLGAVGLLLLTIIVGVVLVVRKPEAGGGVDEPASSAVQVADSGATSEPASGAGSGGQSPGMTDSGTSAPPGSMASRWAFQAPHEGRVFASSELSLSNFEELHVLGRSADDAFDHLQQLSEGVGLVDELRYCLEWDFFAWYLPQEIRPSLSLRKSADQGPPTGGDCFDVSSVTFTARGSSARLFSLSQGGATPVRLIQPQAAAPDACEIPVALRLPWDELALESLAQPEKVVIDLVARFKDGSETDPVTLEFEIQPPVQIEMMFPWSLGYAAVVNPNHPWVRDLVSQINSDPFNVRAQATLGGSDGYTALKMIWRELERRRLRYSNLQGGVGASQRVRPFHEVISDKTANCVEGSAAIASILEAIGISCYLVFPNGNHCKLLIEFEGTDDSGQSGPYFVELECTKLGTSSETDFETRWQETFAAAINPSGAVIPELREGSREDSDPLQAMTLEELGGATEQAWKQFMRSQAEADAERWMKHSMALRNRLVILPVQWVTDELKIRPLDPPLNLGPLPK